MDDDDRTQVGRLGTIMGVWAHPDDEAYLTGGLMAMAVEAGSRVVCVSATRGEHGTSDPVRWPPVRLAALRERELAASLTALGVTEHHWLGFEDGTCATVPPDRAVAALARLITEVGVDTLVTFAADGLTGHADHRTVSSWVSTAWEATDRRARLLHAATTPAFAERFAWLHERFTVYEPGLPAVTPEPALALRLPLDEKLLDRKLDALKAQASQTTGLIEALGEDVFRAWNAEECFVEVPRSDDVGDGGPSA
jgi:LmbE family N-acetylglucosaminyl deacetylase